MHSSCRRLTDKTSDLRGRRCRRDEKQTGEQVGLIREMVRYSALTGCQPSSAAGGAPRVRRFRKTDHQPVAADFAQLAEQPCQSRITSVLAPPAGSATAQWKRRICVFSCSSTWIDSATIPASFPSRRMAAAKPINENNRRRRISASSRLRNWWRSRIPPRARPHRRWTCHDHQAQPDVYRVMWQRKTHRARCFALTSCAL